MKLKLMTLQKENWPAICEMIEEWREDIEKNHTNHSPWAIFKNPCDDYDYFCENLDIKEPYVSESGREHVPTSTLFCYDEQRDRFVGAVNIRHYLNDDLMLTGGHIGDGIRPSERRKGYATAMLGLALEKCKELGIDKVLITCSKDNIGSAKHIQNNGGVLENEVEEDGEILQRYWIDNESYQDINAKTIGSWIEEDDWEWGKPIDHKTYMDAVNGKWDIVLTPTKPVPHHWFGDLKGKKVLGLASGGGQQMPILTALGAKCTVFDYTPQQLESEKLVAEREGYEIETVRGDMSKPLPFEDETFDLIVHPVSNCYVREVEPIFKECYRVLKKGGRMMGGYDNGINFIVGPEENTIENEQPFDPVTNPKYRKMLTEDEDGMQFSHWPEEQIGGQLKAGFKLLELFDDYNGDGYLDELKIPTFMAILAQK